MPATLRSMLFVPGDSDKKLNKAAAGQADALILDLEDAVTAERLPFARGLVTDYLRSTKAGGQQQRWVRINPLTDPMADPKPLADLAAVVAGAPDGILLPKTRSAADVVLLDHYLTVLEQREGVALGATRIITVSTETAQAVLTMQGYVGCSARLAGLTWGAEDLSAAIGAATNREESGEYAFTYRMARSLCLVAAHAAEVQAIDTLTTDFRDTDLLRREVRAARREGFTGKIAIHPDQIDPINAGFSPEPEELAHAQAVVDAFAAAPGVGAVQLAGKMLDRPHLVQAQRVLAMRRAG
jgi:citrate lyase subunit beta/citryl-CoA lyase